MTNAERENLAKVAWKHLLDEVRKACIATPFDGGESPDHLKRLGTVWARLAMTPHSQSTD